MEARNNAAFVRENYKPPAEVSEGRKNLLRGDARRSARGLAWAEVLDEMNRGRCQYGQAVRNIEERRLKP